MGNISNHKSKALVKILRILWCGSCRDIPSKVKDNILHLPGPSHQPERKTTFNGSFWILETVHSLYPCVTLTPIPSIFKSYYLHMGFGTAECSSTGAISYTGHFHHLDHMI